MMINTANITMQFGAAPLFENISVKFSDGNRYGLIGANGCGKSTFMKILEGDLAPTAGNVSFMPNVRVGKLNQDQFAFEDYTVLDAVIMGHRELWRAKTERERIYDLPEMTEEDGLLVAEMEVLFAELDGYTSESRAGDLLLEAGIPIDQHTRYMREIAPGWKLRILLAQALFSDPDVLLLDEPTNNLDIHSISWLETLLNARTHCTMIIISHDRHFLNAVCTHMADMDYGTLKIYSGNYDDYMMASTQAREKLFADNAKKKAQIADLQQFVSRFSANASKAKQATSRAKQIEKIQLDEVIPSSRVSPFIRFTQEKKLYRQALEVKHIAHGFDGKVLFKKNNLLIGAGERVAVIGGNGVGKTTFLRCLINELSVNEGEIQWAENADIGYFAQNNEREFATPSTLIEWMTQWRKPGDNDQAVKAMLGRLLFSADEHFKNTQVCSGGEKARLLFGKLMFQNHNVLMMDEPTNHLDMESIEALNLALENYEGTLIFVSHDRQFVSSLATRIVEIKNTKMLDFKGSYDEYLKSQGLTG